ncbi:MAG: hypothetical protein HFJ28_03110 [Clostridia bacterium]|jgi:hypothetical protein|nr:hypothetical protein [Clostridia bacterium]
MKLKEKLSHFWNVTLGADYIEEIDIEKSTAPEMKELKESLNRIKFLEKRQEAVTSTLKGGKGNSEKVVETVVIDPRAVKAMADLAKAKQTVQKDGEEIDK